MAAAAEAAAAHFCILCRPPCFLRSTIGRNLATQMDQRHQKDHTCLENHSQVSHYDCTACPLRVAAAAAAAAAEVAAAVAAVTVLCCFFA